MSSAHPDPLPQQETARIHLHVLGEEHTVCVPLPLGVQVVGKPFAERDILGIGKAFQEDTGHHRLRPSLG